nr:hypothetical protein StreXyl84_63150 [Streptomyces sp. Xyl84]
MHLARPAALLASLTSLLLTALATAATSPNITAVPHQQGRPPGQPSRCPSATPCPQCARRTGPATSGPSSSTGPTRTTTAATPAPRSSRPRPSPRPSKARTAASPGASGTPPDHYISGPSGLDIDHLVLLTGAWHSGARTWTPTEREAYANDLGDDRDLIAVSAAASNRSKADQDPSTWLPPAAGYHCTYVTGWMTDKTRWSPTIGAPGQTALAEVLEQCPDTAITVTLAR